MKCSSKHKLAGAICTRKKGHEGHCYNKAARNPTNGNITRVEWYSKDGKFVSHKQYQTISPMNAKMKMI